VELGGAIGKTQRKQGDKEIKSSKSGAERGGAIVGGTGGGGKGSEA